ncbi:MAG TPA: coenzyme-B sulfoethylthiotransferase subunit gamma, partial [Methanobacterium sp.]
QVGRPLDKPVDVGEPLDDEYLKEITTIYRSDNVGMREDKEAIEAVLTIHEARTNGGFGLEVFKDDLKRKLGDDK